MQVEGLEQGGKLESYLGYLVNIETEASIDKQLAESGAKEELKNNLLVAR